jgi:4-amino-4-deoxy-L-arabinose transferase-like glycosyltransferase
MASHRRTLRRHGSLRGTRSAPSSASFTSESISRRATLFGLLIAAATGIRLLYFVQLNGTPVIEMQRWSQTDMHYYDEWAQQIAAGDWLSSNVRVPMHRWHREVAQQYFSTHPDARAALTGEIAREKLAIDPEALLWSRWMHVPQFYQDPLYAYLIAVTYRTLGRDARYVLLWQAAAGVGSVILICVLARRYFGNAVAAVAGVVAVFYAPLLFYELLLLRDSLIVFTSLLLIWLTDTALRHGGWGRYAVLGATLSLACLLKSSFLLLDVGIVAGLVVSFRRRWPQALGPLSGLTMGALAAFAPLAARNVMVGVPALSLAQSGPLTFVASNDVSYRPDVGFGINTPLLAAFLGETDGGWRAAVTGVVRSQSAGNYAGMVWRKWDRLWHWYEIPNNENFYYVRAQAPLLSWLPFTFWACAPLGLLGLVLGFKRRHDAWPLYLLVAFSAAPVIIFYVLGRLRLPVVAALIPFAAVTVVEFARALRAQRIARLLVIAGTVMTLVLWTGRPLADDQVLIRMADWILPWSVSYQTKVYEALDARDWARGGHLYLEFFRRYEPDEKQIVASGDPALAPELADMHRECAGILRMAGEPALAQAELDKAERLLSHKER